MSYSHKIDANQNEVVKSLRQLPGISVRVTSMVGDGCPDLIIGYKAMNYLIELKDEKKIPSKKKLTEPEEKFHQSWTGQINVCENLDEILKVINY